MGARLRFAIASAKAHSILLIDEALSVGDRRFKLKSEQRIRELRDSAGLVMIVSHSASSLRDTCERVLWVHKGELRADGPSRDVINDYVKWTKQGTTAVGAASTSKTASKAKTASAARRMQARVAYRAAAQATAAAAAPANAAPAAPRTPTGPVAHATSPGTVRRRRFYQSVRERSRREITALAPPARFVLHLVEQSP